MSVLVAIITRRTFEDLVDVIAKVVDAVLIVERAAVVRDAVLRDVDGRIAVVMLDPVDDAPQAPRYNVQPIRGTSDESKV